MAVAERAADVADRQRRWLTLGATGVVWLVLYRLNEPFWDWLLFDTIGLDADTRFAESAHFFFYDVTKITLLLTGVIFVVTVLRSFMSVERTRAMLGGRREGVGNVVAAGLGDFSARNCSKVVISRPGCSARRLYSSSRK